MASPAAEPATAWRSSVHVPRPVTRQPRRPSVGRWVEGDGLAGDEGEASSPVTGPNGSGSGSAGGGGGGGTVSNYHVTLLVPSLSTECEPVPGLALRAEHGAVTATVTHTATASRDADADEDPGAEADPSPELAFSCQRRRAGDPKEGRDFVHKDLGKRAFRVLAGHRLTLLTLGEEVTTPGSSGCDAVCQTVESWLTTIGAGEGYRYLIRASCALVCGSQIHDLLHARSGAGGDLDAAPPLHVAHDAFTGPCIDGLSEHIVCSVPGLVALTQRAQAARRGIAGQPGCALFTLRVERVELPPGAGEAVSPLSLNATVGRFHVLDLPLDDDDGGVPPERDATAPGGFAAVLLEHLRNLTSSEHMGLGGSRTTLLTQSPLLALLGDSLGGLSSVVVSCNLAVPGLDLNQAVRWLEVCAAAKRVPGPCPAALSVSAEHTRIAHYLQELQDLEAILQCGGAQDEAQRQARRDDLQSRLLPITPQRPAVDDTSGGGELSQSPSRRRGSRGSPKRKPSSSAGSSRRDSGAATAELQCSAATLARMQDSAGGVPTRPCTINRRDGVAFSGAEAVSWLLLESNVEGIDEGLATCRKLLTDGVITAVRRDCREFLASEAELFYWTHQAPASEGLSGPQRIEVADDPFAGILPPLDPGLGQAAPPRSLPPITAGLSFGTLGLEEFGSTDAIHAACLRGDKPAVIKQQVAAHGVEYLDHGFRTPLMYAVIGNQAKVCEALIKLGADVNAKDAIGQTALLWAASKGLPEPIKVLLRAGADVSYCDAEQRTAMHWAAKAADPQCLKLIGACTDDRTINGQDVEMLTPLHWSVLSNNPKNTSLLIKSFRADPNVGDADGRTPLMYSVASFSSSCMKAILDCCGEHTINAYDAVGRSALHVACGEGSLEAARILTAFPGCNIDIQDNRLTTPLHWATVANHPEILQMLLQRHAKSLMCDFNGMTPLQHALQNQLVECSNILKLHTPQQSFQAGSAAPSLGSTRGSVTDQESVAPQGDALREEMPSRRVRRRRSSGLCGCSAVEDVME